MVRRLEWFSARYPSERQGSHEVGEMYPPRHFLHKTGIFKDRNNRPGASIRHARQSASPNRANVSRFLLDPPLLNEHNSCINI